MPSQKTLDVICIGRSSVDLYGEQVGGRLEDMASFAKYVGGCPTNISVGTARLGLKSAVITRVGDEHMGRFIREELGREGVDTSFVITDPERLTALVILGIRDQHTFPLIFYRENCADMALTLDDIDESFIASARAIVVSGTHFSRPGVDAASRAAMKYAHAHGAKVVLDIDYRPVLWGLTGHGLGEERFVAARSVTEHLQSLLPHCDLIVGTEEELHIAAGTTDTLAAIKAVRALSAATIVCKRGPMGCVVFDGPIPDSIDDGIRGPGFPVDVYNVLGAGDAFMSGFLRGWLRGEPLERACAFANACGAFAVSRHGCAPAIPSWTELEGFLENGSPHFRLREDAALNHVHWATTRHPARPEVLALAFDHRIQFEAIADRHGASHDKIPAFKDLVYRAACRVAGDDPAFGLLCDGRYGRAVLAQASGSGCWIGRPIEKPATTPLQFDEEGDVGLSFREWPAEHVVKCLVFYHPEQPEAVRTEQERQLAVVFDAARRSRHELLIEVISPPSFATDDRTMAGIIEHFYRLGLKPDWWKLPPASPVGWAAIAHVVRRQDPLCRGILMLGLDAPESELAEALRNAAKEPLVRGFAIGRTIFGAAAEQWFAGRMTDEAVVGTVAERYSRFVGIWREQRPTVVAAQ